MELKYVLKKGSELLKVSGIESPRLEASILLCKTLNCDRCFLFSHNDLILNEEQIKLYFELIGFRKKHKPLQYILGSQEFMSLKFKVNDHVLIPRQDTEILVETVLDISKNIPSKKIKIADLGTGSGCIAISIAYYLNKCEIFAFDISQDALNIAFENASTLGVADKINFICYDVFNNFSAHRDFDIIVSNPPYIPTIEIARLQEEVKNYEPLSALDGGEDGLVFYKEIIKKAPYLLKDEGFLILEVGYNQSQKVCSLMDNHFKDIQVIKDLNKVERIVLGKL